MKLLLDQNMGIKLVDNIADVYPDSKHVNTLKLSGTSDKEIWQYAVDHNLVLVSTDVEFFNFSILSNAYSKTIYLQGEVVTSNKMEWVLRINEDVIQQFVNDTSSNCLTIKI